MWYLKQNNIIVDTSETEIEGYTYTDEDIICKYDGSILLLESETKTPEYIAEANAWFELNGKRARIDELKLNLANTDYQAIKYAEGLISAEEYASMKAQRQAWRDEINQLENTLE